MRRHARSKRFVLRVSGGVIHLTIPTRARLRDAEAWALSQRAFIEKEIAAEPQPVPFRYGEVLPVLGRDRVIVEAAGRRTMMADDALMIPAGTTDEVAARTTRLLRREALTAAEEALRRHWANLGVAPAKVTVREMKRRWGSCGDDGRTCLNWRLIFAPRHAFDYVAAHEAAHRIHMNHAPAFWSVVEDLMPDYRDHERWLKTRGAGLHAYGARHLSEI